MAKVTGIFSAHGFYTVCAYDVTHTQVIFPRKPAARRPPPTDEEKERPARWLSRLDRHFAARSLETFHRYARSHRAIEISSHAFASSHRDRRRRAHRRGRSIVCRLERDRIGIHRWRARDVIRAEYSRRRIVGARGRMRAVRGGGDGGSVHASLRVDARARERSRGRRRGADRVDGIRTRGCG